MANVHKSKVEYDLLSKLSLCFCPYKHEEKYPLTNDGINETYEIYANSDGYYDTQYIYDKTSYLPGELYRLGVVYILKDGSLSPVFNIRGATNIPVFGFDAFTYKVSKDFANEEVKEEKRLEYVLDRIEYSEEDFMIVGGEAPNENAKGVIQLSENYYTSNNPFPVVGVNITANHLVIQELKKYTKGFFFVRQKRMPLTLAQGVVVGLDNESRTPTLPTLGGVLTDVNFNNSFIETSDINDINYISEGFLSHYLFSLKQKETGLGKKILVALAVVAVLAAAAVATVFTCGAAGVALGVGIASAISLSTAIGATGITVGAAIGIAAGVAAVGAVATVSTVALTLKARQNRNKRAAQAVKGRNEEIPEGYEREEQEESRKLTHNLVERYVIKDGSKNSPSALIVPDY